MSKLHDEKITIRDYIPKSIFPKAHTSKKKIPGKTDNEKFGSVTIHSFSSLQRLFIYPLQKNKLKMKIFTFQKWFSKIHHEKNAWREKR